MEKSNNNSSILTGITINDDGKLCVYGVPLEQGEILKQLDGYGGKYYVSNFAKIFSVYSRRQLHCFDNGYGYLFVMLSDKGQQKVCRVHQLVAQCFIANEDPATKIEVHHRDRNTKNNRADNLQWVSPAEHKLIHQQLNQKRKEDRANGNV